MLELTCSLSLDVYKCHNCKVCSDIHLLLLNVCISYGYNILKLVHTFTLYLWMFVHPIVLRSLCLFACFLSLEFYSFHSYKAYLFVALGYFFIPWPRNACICLFCVVIYSLISYLYSTWVLTSWAYYLFIYSYFFYYFFTSIFLCMSSLSFVIFD